MVFEAGFIVGNVHGSTHKWGSMKTILGLQAYEDVVAEEEAENGQNQGMLIQEGPKPFQKQPSEHRIDVDVSSHVIACCCSAQQE
jgi:hypothetical protein